MAARGEGVLNEKGIAARAGLDGVATLLADGLPEVMAAARAALDE